MLWFEHDLYDQLQLIQILAGLPDFPTRVELICIGSFPGRPDFHGLGELEPDELASLWPRAHRGHARARPPRARRVGRAPRPTTRRRSRAPPPRRTSACPTSRPALRRLLEELPGTRDGLGRTERQLLEAVAAGARDRVDAFLAAMRAEEAPFMGDTTAFDRLARARGAGATTTARSSSRAGRRGGARRPADRVALIGFDRWLGGLHVHAATGRSGAGTTREASSANPDPLASKAMPGTASFRSALEDALPERPFRVVLWDGSEVPPTQPNGGPTFTARSPQALAHVLRAPGELGLGRAYVTGALDVDDLDARRQGRRHLAAARRSTAAPRPGSRSPRCAPPASVRPPGAAAVRAHAEGALPLDRARLARRPPPLRRRRPSSSASSSARR